MKKRFLKVSFFCLLMACMPATFTSCKDYDDDIAVLTEQTGSLQSQVNSLEEALNANKEAAAQAAQAAADAMDAAKAAQATADEALVAAKAAQATGDEALALAKANEAAVAAAQADALNALAAAELAKEAAATAKAEAIAEVMEQVKALMDEQRALTEKELAELAGRIDGIEKGLNELSGALEGVNGELEDVKNEINVVADELATLEQAVAVQKAAFEEFQALINGKIETIEANYADLLETVQGLETSVAALQAADEAIKGDIADVKASVQANATAIAEINTRIDEINTKLDALDKKIDDVKNQAFGYTDAEVAELKAELMGVIKEMDERLGGEISTLASNLTNALNTLSTVFADRLTSITLMPDAYADGIPCIDFSTAVFKEMTGEGDNWNYTDAKAIRLTPNAIPVSYRLSPKSVNQNTIAEVAFVEKTASILTRGAEDDCILNVADFKVENGVLIVTATKNGDAAINKTQDGKINIAALRVSQKETKENGVTIAGAEVHSEYARVTEGVFDPSLAEIEKPTNHLAIAPAKAEIIAEVPYDETLNLYDYVSVCKTTADSHDIMTAEELAAYDFTVEFALADYNKTVWSQIENGVITPGFVREDGTFSAHDKKASKKEQVYRATLKYGEKVIDVKFVKVYFQPSKAEELTINLQGYTSAISCNPVDDYSFTLTWRQFTDVFNNENIRLLNPKEFHGVYTAGDIKVVYKFNGKDITKHVPAVADVTLDAERQYAMSFTFNDNIPDEVWVEDKNKDGKVDKDEVEKVFPLSLNEVTKLDIEVICTPNYLKEDTYPVLTIATSLTIEPLRESLSKMAPQFEQYWFDDNTLRVLPVQIESGYAEDKCVYHFPLQQAFFPDYKNCVVDNDKLGCAMWDVVFAKTNGYYFTIDGETGAQLEWDDEHMETTFKLPADYTDLGWEKCSAQTGNEVFASVFENPQGRKIIHANEPLQITFVSRYPNGQVIPVKSYDLKFVKPLNFETAEFKGFFIDGAIETDAVGYRINTANQFIIKDFRDKEVSKDGTNGLYEYYGVQDYKWHVDEARIGLVKVGDKYIPVAKDKVAYTENGMVVPNKDNTMLLSKVTNADLALKVEGDYLIYENEGGLPTEQEYYLVVPVTVEHKWGKLIDKELVGQSTAAETAVVIPVKPGTIKNKVRK